MRSDKYNRIIATAQYHRGPATIAHVLSTVTTDQDIVALPGRIIGKIANIRHAAYIEGKTSQKIDTWAYDGVTDFLAGLGKDGILEVTPDSVTIRDNNRNIIARYVRQDLVV